MGWLRSAPLKKLLLVLALLAAGYFAWRNFNPSSQLPDVAAGKTFNRLFPESGGGFTVQFTQEKAGYAQADLLKDGKKLAHFSISDTNSNPSAREKFKSSTRQLAGNPATAVGSLGTAILIADRYQVQVRSADPAFTVADREAWLLKFKLGAFKS